MSWTQGQHNRVNQSPFIDPAGGDDRNPKPASSSYSRPNVQRNDTRGDYNQRTPSQAPRSSMPREVAATFTQEGLQTFSLIFSSAVEAAMAKSLPDLIEKAVERKMQEIMNQFLLEMNRMKDEFSLLVDTKMETAMQSSPTPVQPKEEAMAATPEFDEEAVNLSEQVPAFAVAQEVSSSQEPSLEVSNEASEEMETPESTATSQVRNKADVDRVVDALKAAVEPVTTDQLRSLLPDLPWGNNPSVKMNGFIRKSGGLIERAGRGLYQIRKEADVQ